MLQNLTKTRTKLVCMWLTFVPRAFLQIFITTTLNHRLARFNSHRFDRLGHGRFQWHSTQKYLNSRGFSQSFSRSRP